MAKDQTEGRESNNGRNLDKRKAYLDFYRLAQLTNDYTEEELEEFKYFDRSLFRSVKPDQLLLVRNRLHPGRGNVQILGEGLHFFNPVTEETILVPNPSNPIVINYRPKDEKDKQENFTFTTNINPNNNANNNTNNANNNNNNNKEEASDELYCDYKVSIRLIDPIQYFYSSRSLQTLSEEIVEILRVFVGTKKKSELMTQKSGFPLSEIAPKPWLDKYRREYGIEIVSIGFNSVKETDAVREARNKIAEEKQNIERERAIAERRKVEAEGKSAVKDIETAADVRRYSNILSSLRREGIPESDLAFLIGVSMRGDAVKELRESDKAHVFVNMGEGMMGMNPMMYFASRGENTSASKKYIEGGNVIDADFTETDDESQGRKRN